MYLNEKFNAYADSFVDERVRRRLHPKRVVLTKGNVTGEDVLLRPHPDQVTLFAGEPCALVNGEAGENAAVLVDFGIELHGSVKLMVYGVDGEGGRVNAIVRTGESVSEALTPLGVNNTTNDHATRDRVMNIGFISVHETNESGFRFAYVELLDKNASLRLMAIDATAVYRDLDYIGSFECDDERVNEIWRTAAYTVHVNMQNLLWDGIKRDRLVWIGDMHTEVMTILSVFGQSDIIPRSLDAVRNETPLGQWMNGISSYSLWWVLIQYEWYLYKGDKEYLSQQREYLTYLTRLLFEKVDECGVEKLDGMRFLDWPTSGNTEAIHCGLHALLKMTFEKDEVLLRVLGEDELADKCSELTEKMKKHIPDTGNNKPAAALLALSGIGDAAELNENVIAPLGAKGYSTFFGYYILAAKHMAGDVKGAVEDMKKYWGGMLDMGATTFWEDFDIDWMKNASRIDEPVPDGKVDIHATYGGYCYKQFRHSLCHGWSSGPVPFAARHLLGVEILEPGGGCVRVKPDIADFKYIKGSVPTPHGIIKVYAERRDNGEVYTKIDVPDGIKLVND